MKNYLKIDSVYAYISVDKEGNEGICSIQDKDGHWHPLIGADEERLASIKPMAESIAKRSGHKVKLIKLTQREDMEEINP